MHWLIALACTAVAVAATIEATPTGNDGFVPFPVDWKEDVATPADLSFLLHPPAGKSGRVHIAGGHLVGGDGKRLRLWGVNVTMAAGMPAKQSAPIIAHRLAQCGVNCVRFHFMDVFAPNGLIQPDRDDTQHLDPAQLDRLDFFIAELKKRGIYADLNLNVAHPYKPGDGVRDSDLLGFAKSVTYYDPRLIELQKAYARALLTHRNPYTGARYADEPCVALVELLNEDSLVELWSHGFLKGCNTTRNPGTWTDIPASYERPLTEMYNAWLKERLSESQMAELRREAGVGPTEAVPRLQPEEFGNASNLRFETEASFYMDVERRFFSEMSRFLKQELGVKAPIIGSSDHDHWRSGYLHQSSTSLLDVVDGHVYWQHPEEIRDPQTGRYVGFRIANTPMVADPLHSTPVQLSRSAIAGKPYTVSETNHPFPAEAACEGIPILAAYAALQDWDGIFWYTLGHSDPVPAPGRLQHFDLFPDPVKMAQLRAGALLFLREDVATAKTTVTRSYSRQQVIESMRLPSSTEWPYFTPGFDLATPLTHAVRIASLNGPPTASFQPVPKDPIRSDTGQIIWRTYAQHQGVVTVQTPRSQVVVGHVADHPQALENLSIETKTPFCAVTLSSLDGKPIGTSERLLLTVCGRVANTGMRWDAERRTLTAWGDPPARIEPVAGTVTLRNLVRAKSVSAVPMDGAGRALGSPQTAVGGAGGWSIPLGEPATTWYVVTVER